MFIGFISKRKLKAYMRQIQSENRARNLGQDYTSPISEKQQKANIYAQGYEDGTDNVCNAVYHKFKLK